MKNRLILSVAAIWLSVSGSGLHAWDQFEYGGGANCCQEESHFFATAQYLLWSTDYSLPIGFKYVEGASTKASTTPGVVLTDETLSGSFFQPHQKWTSGVRVGIGWEAESIDVRGYWTGYRNEANKTVPTAQSIFISGIINDLANDSFVGDSTSASACYKLNYNIADLEVGKTFHPSNCVSLRPFAGLRGAWIHQDNLLSFNGSMEVLPVGAGLVTVDLPQSASIRHHTAGVGPRLGLETVWGDWHGFSVIGNFSAALLFAEPKTRFEFITTSASVVGATVDVLTETLQLNDDYWQLIPNFQLQFGVNWGMDFNCNRNHFNVFATFETNFWWETSTIVVIHRGLGLQGLTTGISFDF